ncbi:MAG: non-canonical purine NTP pyrophosphatase, partial [candidate division WOR-3 bacterium]|nr:non-canonical purine NTP pyrophosphatase [candidate division WOR-3 bacterium]
ATYQDNVKKFLKLLEGIANRQARFRCVCAVALPDSYNLPLKIFEGVCSGVIADKPKGESGFGYDPVFIPDGFDKTFAELSPEEKNKISHRAKALIKVKEFLNQMNIK